MLQQSDNNAYEVVQRLVTKEVTSGLEKLWEHNRYKCLKVCYQLLYFQNDVITVLKI